MADSVNAPVGNEREYSKEPFKDNVAKSIPPAVKGAGGGSEGDMHHAHGGKSYGDFVVAKRQFEADRNSKERSPWCK